MALRFGKTTVEHLSINRIKQYSENDSIGLYVQNQTDTSDITITEANMAVVRVS